MLEKRVGTWDVETTITPAPGAPGISLKGTSHGKMMGGWLIADYQADSGFAGHGVYGQDGDKYVASWVDTAMSSFARGEGVIADGALTLWFEARHEGKKVSYREIWKLEGDDTLHYRHLVPTPEGGEHEMIRSVYKKRHA